MKKRVFFLTIFFFAFLQGNAQEILAEPVRFAWAGGMNSCQYCAIDLDLDGRKDLMVFDRQGNRKLTFLYAGPDGSLNYIFSPELAEELPLMNDWVITADYNHDGRMDLFTYHNGGARVYRNDSEGSLKFTLITNLLESWYYGGYVGILITSVDYPGIADMDGDGDLDLITFFGLGSWVEYHRNLSVEKYGHPDTLDFRLEDPCWGRFKESESSNRIQLDAGCWTGEWRSGGVAEWRNGGMAEWRSGGVADGEVFPKHTGSTLTLFDLNGDGLQDLILGDVDFPNLIALYNSGTPEEAFMGSMDTLFPANNQPVNLFSFPLASRIDIDHDGLDDLVVSPFDPSLSTSDNIDGNWFYRNTGTAQVPVFELQTRRFLQEEMLDFGSASRPLLFDMDQDGLTDLIAGSAGYYDSSYYYQGILKSEYISRISYYRNEGTSQLPLFRLMTSNLANLDTLRLAGLLPAAGDLNGDGRMDLITGRSDGTLILFPGTGSADQIPLFGAPQYKYAGIDVGDNSAPQLFDLDRDGLADLIIGEKKGNLNWYRNTGMATAPLFTLITDSLGKVNVTDPTQSYDGFSTPLFFRLPEGSTRLACGSENGKIWYFSGIDQNLGGAFLPSDSLPQLIGEDPSLLLSGWRTSPALAHLTSPDRFDLITGNFAGGLQYLSHQIHPSIPETPATTRLNIYPNPADETVRVEWRTNPFAQNSAQWSRGAENPGNTGVLFVTDPVGRLWMKLPFSGTLEINTRHLPNGLYLLRLEDITLSLVISHK